MCENLVRAYLGAQDWQLVPAAELALAIWTDSDVRLQTDVALFKTRVCQEAWIRYAAILYAAGRKANDSAGENARYNLAWRELDRWLSQQVRRLTLSLDEQQNMVQQALLKLHRKLERENLNAPRAFLTYSLQTLTNCHIDTLRRQAKEKRESDQPLTQGEGDRPWDEQVAVEGPGLEDEVVENETQERLRHFFVRHLTTPLQRQVAEMFFIHGLEAQAIAAQLNKQPHEIRLVKARLVAALRSLPEVEKDALLRIIKGDQDDQ